MDLYGFSTFCLAVFTYRPSLYVTGYHERTIYENIGKTDHVIYAVYVHTQILSGVFYA